MNKKVKVLKVLMTAAWIADALLFSLGFISVKLLALTGISVAFAVLPIVLTIAYIIVSNKAKKSNKPDLTAVPAEKTQSVEPQPPAPIIPPEKQPEPIKQNNEFERLMTGQLIAFYKIDHDKKYMDEYIRRLVGLGFTEEEAFNLFANESMNMKHDSVKLLQSPTYIIDFYFNLKNRILPLDNDYYIKHRMFCVSEITKIWDEAEWHYHNSHEADMPDDVWHEIYMLTRYGSGELFIKMLTEIAVDANIDISKIQKYSRHEQDMLFKYKWHE